MYYYCVKCPAMMASYYLMLMVLVGASKLGLTFVLEDAAQKSLKLPKEYHLRGEEVNILAGIVGPFEAWYSESSNRSRVDYNRGAVKQYYALKDDDIMRIYFIYPFTTKELTNALECRKEALRSKELFNILPNVTDYKYKGQKTYNGKLVDVWKYFEDNEKDQEKTEKMLYVYQDNGTSIPIYHEIKIHDLWTGTVDTHTVTRYYGYSKLEDEALDHNLEESCNKTKAEFSNLNENFHELPPDIEGLFSSYVMHHQKQYDGDEHEIRKQIFEKNFRRVVEHNSRNLGYKLTLNKFSDRTDDELAVLMGTLPSRGHVGTVSFPHTEEEVEQIARELPENYDMRIEGYISSIKNQGDCGSCWSFATVAALEGALARSNGGRNLDLSEQSLVDCSWGYGNYGCDGGMIDDALEYVLKHGVPTEMAYGLYSGQDGWCGLENMTSLYRIKGFAAVPPLSANAMKVALYKYGPVVVTINAGGAMVHYHSGIYYDPSCNDEHLNHAVTVVGYGTRDGADYWIVKNSYGEDWGEDGYILISAADNTCHILENAFYPII